MKQTIQRYFNSWISKDIEVVKEVFAEDIVYTECYGPQYHDDGRVKYALEKTPDDWHVFAMDWRPDGYVFYCDGKEVSRTNTHVSQVPQFILLTTEILGYRSAKKYAASGETPPFVIQGDFVDDAFIADYVRVFDRVEK